MFKYSNELSWKIFEFVINKKFIGLELVWKDITKCDEEI